MKTEFSEVASCDNIFDAFVKALVNYFNFKGRTSRYDYWGFCFVNFLIQLLFTLLGILAIRMLPEAAEGIETSSSIYGFIMIIPWIAAATRRLHDTDRSALQWLLAFPVAGAILLVIIGVVMKMENFIVFVSFAIFIYLISLLVVLCFRGKSEDNKYGKAVAEDAGQRWKGLAMPIFISIIPLLSVLALGIVGGYSKARITYRIRNTVPLMYDMLAEAKGYKTGMQIADVQSSGAEAVGILRESPEGGVIKVERVGKTFVVTYSEVLAPLCFTFMAYNWAEHPDFESLKVEDDRDCQSCTENAPCTLIWNYK